MTGDFTVALHRVHISEIHTAAFDFGRTDQNGAFPYSVDVHMTVGPVFKLLDGSLIVMRRIEKELTEGPGVMRIRERTSGHRTELAEKWNDTRDCTDNIMRFESDDRVLSRIFRRTHIFFRLMGDLSSCLPVQRNPQAS